MALDKATAIASITAVLENKTNTAVQAATGIMDAIDIYVKTAVVSTTVTIPITSAPGSPSTGTGTGTLS